MFTPRCNLSLNRMAGWISQQSTLDASHFMSHGRALHQGRVTCQGLLYEGVQFSTRLRPHGIHLGALARFSQESTTQLDVAPLPLQFPLT